MAEQKPKVTINGEEIKAKKPKFGYLRKVAKFEEENRGADINEVLDDLESLVCEAFQDERVTPEALEDNIDIDEMKPLIKEVMGWAMSLFQGKMSEAPNQKSPASQK